MKEIFILRRPGLIVISGTVKEIRDGGLVIEGDHAFPISGPDTVKVNLNVSNDVISNMRIQKGASVIASTTDHFLVEMLQDGGETPDREFSLDAFVLRYNGSFDFDPHGDSAEEHVIAGIIKTAKKLTKTKNNLPIYQVTVGWKRNGAEELRTILYCGPENVTEKARVIFVTGPLKTHNGSPYYEGKNVFDF